MSTGYISIAAEHADRVSLPTKVAAYWELTKPRIAFMELIVVAAACFIGSAATPSAWLLTSTLLGTKVLNGDIVKIASVSPKFENEVTLRGNVANSGRFPYREGIRLKDCPAFAVQYHPEASAGPHDSQYLFGEFVKMLR